MKKRYLISDRTGGAFSEEKRSALENVIQGASDDVSVKKFTPSHVVIEADPDVVTRIGEAAPDLIVEEDEPLTRL